MKNKFLWVLFILFLFVASASADPCLDSTDPLYNPFCEDLDMPLDSGVGLLIGATAFYTVSRIRKKKQ
ncbi:MAG TPA: hypothetical protein VF602_01225 [Pedobacter sp.]|jgi:hypothetical protein